MIMASLSGMSEYDIQLRENYKKQQAAKPTWKISFAQTYGNAYNQAKADGASEGEAIIAENDKGWVVYGLLYLDANTGEVKKFDYAVE